MRQQKNISQIFTWHRFIVKLKMIKFQQFSFQSEILPKSVRGPEIHVHRNMLKFFWKERYFNHYTLWVLSFCTLSSRLIEFCQENTLVIANTLFQQHKRNSTHGHHKMVKLNQIDYILCSQRWRSSTVSKNKTGADCGSDHEHLIAKLRLKLKKVGKITRSFRFDVNQIPTNYTVEVTNRLKG